MKLKFKINKINKNKNYCFHEIKINKIKIKK